MTTLREAAERALEALEVATTPRSEDRQTVLKAQAALRAALAPVPVAWMDREGDLYKMPEIEGWAPPHTLLYTHPPQRQPLADEEILKMWDDTRNDPIAPSVFCLIACVRHVERAHGIGGKG